MVESLKRRIKKIDMGQESRQKLPGASRHERSRPGGDDRPFCRHFFNEKLILPKAKGRGSELFDIGRYRPDFLFQKMINIEKAQGQFLGKKLPNR